ncbi:N-acetylated-alpha-linked acidic dipeptidase 2-like isoform X2 [Tachypleus tridentatus]|uniref:N-acetylated-alpha-linked acidic dipeptidase 2-like isoform X2 n=1 Tax=Tachypleus tridentatus TaxID=6853 RepID=UPI003FD5A21D
MADCIRGKKAYTKWDVETDNVDLDLPVDGQPEVQGYKPGWFSGTKGKVLKALFIIAIFLVGLIFGYLVRRGVHEVIQRKETCSSRNVYSFKNQNAQLLHNCIDPNKIAGWLRYLSEKVQKAGSDSGKELALEISKAWKKYDLQWTRIENFTVLLSYSSDTSSNSVKVISHDGKTLVDTSRSIENDSSEAKPYLAYSPNGTAQGKPVYANYGRVEDFHKLLDMNVTINGSVVIMKQGKTHRGNKIALAEKYGAVAAVLYPDPHDVVPPGTNIFPDGLGLPGDGIVRGNLKTYPGDPQTPILPSSEDMYRLPTGKISMASIPAQVISYDDAWKILIDIGGPAAPERWKGNLVNVSYNIGPGFDEASGASIVKVQTFNELREREIHNVIATIPGKTEPDRYVIVGSHHDSWSYGTSDPGIGTAVLMELARSFGHMRKQGWQPERTMVLASWDAEEFGIIGSEEWTQAHDQELYSRAVAYINIDAAVTVALGSPLLRQALVEATSLVPCHDPTHPDMSAYEMWKLRQPQDKNKPQSEPEIKIAGSGSDFVSFLAGRGISSVHLQFVGKNMITDYPLYHTEYDVFDAMANYTDHNFESAKTIARIVGTLALKLTDSLELPLRANHYAEHIERHLKPFLAHYRNVLNDFKIDLGPLKKAFDSFSQHCLNFHNNFDTVDNDNLLLAMREYNDKLLQLERAFLLPYGVFVNPYYRHVLYGPDPYNNYQGIIFPHLVTSLIIAQENNTADNWNTVREHLSYVIHAFKSAEQVLGSSLLKKPNDEL